MKKASRLIVEKYYPRLTLDFHTNKVPLDWLFVSGFAPCYVPYPTLSFYASVKLIVVVVTEDLVSSLLACFVIVQS